MAEISKPYVPTSRAHPSAGMQAEKSAPLEYSPSGGEGRAQQDFALAQQDYPDATMYQMPGDTDYIYGFRTLPDGTVEDFVVDKMGKRLNLAANPAALEAVRKQRLQRPDIGGEPSAAVMNPEYRDIGLASGETLEGARVSAAPGGLLTATGDAPARTIPYEDVDTLQRDSADVDPGLEAFDRFGPLGPDSSPEEYDFVRQLAASKALEQARSRPTQLRDPREGMSRSQLEDLNPARSRRDRERMMRSGTGQRRGGIRPLEEDPMQEPYSGRGPSLAELRGEDVVSPKAKAAGATFEDKQDWLANRRQGVAGRHLGRMEEAKAERQGRSPKKES